MLTSLTIRNYAIIRDLQIDFANGLIIITGETGAGKSILLGALSLLIGQRADTGVLFDSTRKCIVEGVFLVKDKGLEDLFLQNDLDIESELIIRREIGADGKSRAFINDTPVNVSVLKEFGERLIDIHSQHQNLYLENPAFQLSILDTFSQQADLISRYKETFSNFRKLLARYTDLKESIHKNKADLEFFTYQYNQLNEAKLVNGEQEKLEEELNTLTHAEEIKIQLHTTINNIQTSEISAISLIKEIVLALSKIRNVYPPSHLLLERINAILIELKDITSEVESESEHIEYNPERTEFVKQRIDLLYNLMQKNRVTTTEELIQLREQLKNQIENVENADSELDKIKLELDKQKAQLENIATTITQNRKKIVPQITENIKHLLLQLGMPNADFLVELTETDDFTPTGKDKVRFMFSANKQSSVQELSKVASGGEMARLMLAVKATVAGKVSLPTIIFDEIDQGVSGDIADKMGNIIARIAQNAQVINITHLPQIASKGNNHYLVYKQDLEESTQTQIKKLESDDRVIEIARMLSGEKLTEAAINNAKALLGIN